MSANGERYEFLRWGQKAFRQFPRRAARHRHLPSGQSRISGAEPCGPRTRTAETNPLTPIRWSAPIAIPRWSTGLPCSAGAVGGHRGRGGDAGSAHHHADPRGSSASSSPAGINEGESPRPISSSRSPRCCARKGKGVVRQSFVEFYMGRGLDFLSLEDQADDRQHGARIRARTWRVSFPGRLPNTAGAISRPRARDPKRRRAGQKHIPKPRACSARRTRPTRFSPDAADARPSRPSCRRCPDPKRPQDRVSLVDAAPEIQRKRSRTSAGGRKERTAMPASVGRGAAMST